MTLTEFLLARTAEDEAAVRLQVGRDPIPADCWGPSRVLAECEAKRRIVERLTDVAWCSYAVRDVLLAEMALPYADHPDYQPDWKL